MKLKSGFTMMLESWEWILAEARTEATVETPQAMHAYALYNFYGGGFYEAWTKAGILAQEIEEQFHP